MPKEIVLPYTNADPHASQVPLSRSCSTNDFPHFKPAPYRRPTLAVGNDVCVFLSCWYRHSDSGMLFFSFTTSPKPSPCHLHLYHQCQTLSLYQITVLLIHMPPELPSTAHAQRQRSIPITREAPHNPWFQTILVVVPVTIRDV